MTVAQDELGTNSPSARVREQIWGFITSQVLGAVAALGLADALEDAEKDATELAAQTRLPEATLYRLLRAAASLGILREAPGRRFNLTEEGQLLRRSAPGSLHGQAIAFTDPWAWMPWAYFREAIRTGRPQARRALGSDLFAYLAEHSSEEHAFSLAMGNSSSRLASSVLEHFDFTPYRTIVDIGAAHGELLTSILRAYPAARGVCFDRAGVAEAARSYVERSGVAVRCHVLAGDFFERAPAGGDLYVLKLILHDWPDPDAERILRTIRLSMRAGAHLLLIELLVPPEGAPSVRAHRSDLQMLVTFGSSERSASEFAALLARTGFALTSTTPIHDEWALLLAVAAPEQDRTMDDES